MNDKTDEHAIDTLMSLRRIIDVNHQCPRAILPFQLNIESRFRVDRAFYLLKQKLPEKFINESIYDIHGNLRFEILGIQTRLDNDDKLCYYQNTFVMKGKNFLIDSHDESSTYCLCDDCRVRCDDNFL